MYINGIIAITVMVNSKRTVKCFSCKEVSDACLQLHRIVTVVISAVRVTKIAAVYFYAHVCMLSNTIATLSRLGDKGFTKV